MKTVRADIGVVTGAQWTCDVQLVEQGTPVAVEAVTPGGMYYVHGLTLTVHSVRDLGNGWHELVFEPGTYGAPTVQYPTGALIAPADPVPALEAVAKFAAEPVATPYEPVEIPTSISGDGSTVTLTLPADITATMPAGAYSWDLYVRTTRWDWQRVVQGTLSVVDGDAR